MWFSVVSGVGYSHDIRVERHDREALKGASGHAMANLDGLCILKSFTQEDRSTDVGAMVEDKEKIIAIVILSHGNVHICQ